MPVFPSQNLYSQRICETYNRLLQIYSGSIVLDGTGSQKQFLDITASYAINATVGTGNTITQSYYSSSIWTFNHNSGEKYILIQAFDSNQNQIIPDLINLYDENTAIITFGGEYVSGTAVGTLGGFKTTYTQSITSSLLTGSTYPITSSHCLTSSYVQNKSFLTPIKKIYSNYQVTQSSDYTMLCNAISGSFYVKLPNPIGHSNVYNIKKIDSTSNPIHVVTTSNNYIDYDVTQSILFKGNNLMVQSDGTNQYWIL